MTPEQIREARKHLGLNQSQFAKLLGYSSNVRISELERGVFEINGAAARLISAYIEGYRPNDWPLADTVRPRIIRAS